MSYSSSEVRSDSLILSSRDADWSRPGIIDDHAYLDDPGRPSFSERSLWVVEKPNWSILAIAAERRALKDFHTDTSLLKYQNSTYEISLRKSFLRLKLRNCKNSQLPLHQTIQINYLLSE